MSYTLPDLPYAHDALEPSIDQTTMEIHHGKHHAAYVANLNKALESAPDVAGLSVEELIADNCAAVPESIRTAVRNNGGGHANHSLFWQIMGPGKGGEPVGNLGEAINAKYGGFEQFKEQFAAVGMTRFGSGWAWLLKDVEVISTPNQDSPLMEGRVPIIGLDVWEHAYYLKFQNKRPDYVDAFFNVVNWEDVERRYQAAIA